MIEEIIGYYQRELAYLRDAAGAFAEAHPKIASRLRLSREAVEDPHIGRLIESTALLNARLRHKLDDDFPELSDTLLLTLFPSLIQPLPSLLIAQLTGEAGSAKPALVPRGTVVLTEPVNGEPVRYRTAWDTTLLPLRIDHASLGGLPLDAPALGLAQAKGVLRLSLRLTGEEASFGSLELDTLRLYIRSDARRAQILLEQLGVNLLGIGVGSGPADPAAILLPPGALRLMGMTRDELLLPQGDAASTAYAIVQEHFAYPAKHLFVEVSGLAGRALTLAGDRLDLFFYLDRASPELERVVRADDFALHAVPALNLFAMEAEPIQLDHEDVEYRIIPDARREDAIEVHSVSAVTLQRGSGERVAAPPLHSIDRGTARLGRFFHALHRRSSIGPGGGDDLFVSVADLDGTLMADPSTIVQCEVLAMNRELPTRIPFGGGRPLLSVDSGVPGLAGVAALTKPTPTRRPSRRRAAVWKLIGQLSLNHLGLTGGARGAQVLREILALYDVADTPESAGLRDRLVGVAAVPGVGRIRVGGHTAMVAGTDLTIEVEDERLSGSGSFLLTVVLERFLASACALNSFTRVATRLRRETGEWKRWPARVGERDLV